MPPTVVQPSPHRLRSIARAAACLAVGVLALSASQAPAATRVPLTMQANAPFPIRVFAVDLSRDTRPDALAVTENGHRVAATLTPIRRKRVPFSAALVLDTSRTMTGGPFAASRAAAEALIRGKLPRAELALFGFAARPYVLHGWSARKAHLADSLTGVRPSYGTAVWEAVVLASRQLQRRQGSTKALVLLTDGKPDTTDRRVRAAIAAARSSGARVYVVVAGKGDPVQRELLQGLAHSTGGALVSVRSIPELRRTFAGLAKVISRQYLISYSSPLRKPGGRVVVRADFGRAFGTAAYAIPKRPPAAPETFWYSVAGSLLLLVGVLALIAGAVGALVVVHLRSQPRWRTQRTRSLSSRLSRRRPPARGAG